MKNKERIQLLENRINIQSKILEKITTLLEIDNEQIKLKQLDQSVFDGTHKMWKFAAVDEDGALFKFEERPELTDSFWANVNCSRFDRISVAGVYDTTDWQTSLIERETIELTGSELCKAMLARGDTRIMCIVSDEGSRDDLTHVIRAYYDGKFHTKANSWKYVVPINNHGEPLTSSDVGL